MKVGKDQKFHLLNVKEDKFFELMEDERTRMSGPITLYGQISYKSAMTTNKLYETPNSIRVHIYNVPVHFVPNISGMALVPKIILEELRI